MQAVPPADVLVVDDNNLFRELVTALLEAEGHHVVPAGSGADALTQLAERPFDLVVSDYRMPGGDGLSLLTSVRPRHPDLPFLLWSCDLPDDVARRARELGACTGTKSAPPPVQELLAA